MATTTPENMETFTTEDLEDLEFVAEDLEGIAEEIEEESLEDLEDLEFSAEGVNQEALPLLLLGKVSAKYLVKLLLKVAMKLITKIAGNARLRSKLQEIVKKGGRPAFCRVMCTAICRTQPPVLRPLCVRFCPVICAKIWPIAARKLSLAV